MHRGTEYQNRSAGLERGFHGEIIQKWTPPSSPGAKLENGGLPYTESPLSFDGFN